mgnify:CR=1 FL=1
MKYIKPGRIEDNAPAGHQATPMITKKSSKYKIVVELSFDDNLKESQLWDYLYDVETVHFELDATPDYEKRIQYYEIGADRKALQVFRLWLIENSFVFKLVRC